MNIDFARLAHVLKRVTTDYRWSLYYLQRTLYHPILREWLATLISYFLPRKTSQSLPKDSRVFHLVQTLKDDGLVILDNFVTPQQVTDIKAFLSTKLCADPQRPGKAKFSSPEFAHKCCVHAYYEPDDIVKAPHLLELANSPTILSIVEQVFGAKPTISLLQVWWLMAGFDMKENSEEIYAKRPLEFHRDIDDWSEIKFFIYLTDVDEEAGPHAFIKESHTWLLPFRKRALDFDSPNFPMPENLIKLTGKAGLAWLENSYGLHRAIIPTQNHRLIVAVTYTLFPLPFSPKSPIYKHQGNRHLDSYINRIYVAS